MIPVVMTYFPSGISVKTIHHYAQIINSGGRFRQYDYGNGNVVKYGSVTPPEYEVWKISLPVYMLIGNQDFLAPREVRIIHQNNILNSFEPLV